MFMLFNEEEYPITLTDLQQLASYDASIKSPAADKRSKKIPKPKSLTLKSKHKKQIVKKKREKENLQPALARIQPVEPKHELAPPIMDKIKSGKEVVEMDDDEEDVPSQHEEENSSSTKVDSRGNLQIQAELMEDELREMIVKFEPELQVDEIESEDNQTKVRPIKVKENARRKATRIRPAVKKIKHKNPELNKKKPKDELNDDQFIEVEAGGSQLNQETAIINEAGSSSKQIRSKRSMEPAKYVCECGKVFKRNQSLNSHRNFVCGKIKTNYCHRCKQFFWAKHQLVQHKKVCMMNFTTAQ